MRCGGAQHELFHPGLKADLDQIVPAHGGHLHDFARAEGLVAHPVADRKACLHGGLRRGGRGIGRAPGLWRLPFRLCALPLPVSVGIAARDALLDVFLRDLGDEAGDAVCGGAAEEHTLAGGGEIQLLLRPRDGHIAEPALLLHLLRLPDGAGAGENGLLHADDEHRRKLKALGAVDGHEHHGVGLAVVGIHVRIEGHVCQIPLQRLVPGLLHVGEDAGLELAHVLGAGGVLGGVFLLEGAHVAGLLQQLVQHLVRSVGGGKVLELQDQVCEKPELRPRAAELGELLGVPQDLEHGLVPLGGKLPDLLHGPRSDAPGRDIDDARKAQIVRRGGDEAEVGQDILDFGPVKEARAADDAVGDAAALEGVFKLVGLGVHAV